MAFNFNWSPLAADGEFYRRCRDLLTAALNKSPKPPIIVGDILVTEFNLGSVPPDLEILEIGDLAEDRFRGIFKMCYGGDAFLTLKTKVQANPLNTYLDSKPAFTSPKPLAAASGLTIPLSITLSEIKLSAFIILVFSKQKGLTLVFRNDPLESLKVSSTFDSIQFVRDYLQRTIEGQLRNLMMNELPAIIHRLSLQFWCPDQPSARNGEEDEVAEDDSDESAADPLASPPLDPVDANGNVLDEAEVSRLSLDGGREVQLTFAQKNVLFGSSLSELNRTLQMRSPSMREVVFRGWAGDAAATGTSTPGNHLRSPLVNPSSSTTYTFSDYGSATTGGYLPSRSSLVSLQSATAGLSVGAGSRTRSYAGRKKKTRIVNLRRSNSDSGDKESVAAPAPPEPSSPSSSSDVDNEPVRPPPLKSVLVPAIPQDQDEVFVDARTSPPRSQADPDSPKSPGLGFDGFDSALPTSKQPPRPQRASYPPRLAGTATANDGALFGSKEKSPPLPLMGGPLLSARRHHQMEARSDPAAMPDQQWIMKMAGEIARRVYDEKRRQQQEAGAGPWDERDDAPPPAYEAAR